ncbi:MAG: hypothetical protein QMD36_01405 [Candidatus Aenigmarchaeota archaeon]|nr:hypothetical protein [Candidatus Aenigmarchaeota archaeon]
MRQELWIVGDPIFKKNTLLLILITVALFSLTYQVGLSVSSVTISCPSSTCFVNDCRCTISGCTSGYVYFYPTTDCSGIPTSKKEFSDSSFNWQPTAAGKYYLKVNCGSEWSDCTEVTVSSALTTTTTSTTVIATTTTTISRQCTYDNPCPADCGKRKLNKTTSTQDYFEFVLDSVSNVTVRLEPSQNVDYDLYVNWDGTKPKKDDYDCKPSKDIGIVEECKKSGLLEGTYYIMVDYYEGTGTYNLSLTCTPIEPVTLTCSNPDQPCKIDCGKSKLGRSTSTRDYFMFKLTSTSNVTIKLFPNSNVDYDLYVNWDGTKPTMDKYDCKSSYGKGEKEECSIPNQDFPMPLKAGNYYMMIDFYEGVGTYDLSLSCSPIKITTTTTVVTTTTTSVFTTTSYTATTVKATTTTTKPSRCGINGYCESLDEECMYGYEECDEYETDCGVDEKCCCVAKIQPEPSNLGLTVGLIVVLLVVILLYFFIKSKRRITFEKLYRKWSRVLIERPRV